jgi:predicted O-methyltransferase YrrM
LECDTYETGQFVYRKLLPIVGTRPFPPNELMLMCASVIWLRPRLIIEWGTNIGVSARIFYEANMHYRIGADIHSVDLPPDVKHGEHPGRRRGFLVRGLSVHMHEGDGATVAKALIKEAGFERPLVFIDGDHAYESVLRDAREVLQAAPLASLLFHDTFYQPGSIYNHGPYEAVQRIVAESATPMQIVSTASGCPGMTLVTPAECIGHVNNSCS